VEKDARRWHLSRSRSFSWQTIGRACCQCLQPSRRHSTGRPGFGEAGTPFEQEKDPLIKRETLELVRAYYKIREGCVRKRIFEMVKAVGAASHAEVLGGRKKR
jgi:hypothetical protein